MNIVSRVYVSPQNFVRIIASAITLFLLVTASHAETYRITIDGADTQKTVSRYLVGANFVYAHEDQRSWEDGCKTELLKHLGLSNLRYPGGGQTSFWDWEWPYHDAYQLFWDPVYIATLDEAKRNELYEAHQHRLSLDKYLEICKETGAVPLIGINMVQGWKFDRLQDSIDKAVRLVNYVKDKIDGPRYYFLDNEAGHQPEKERHIPTDIYPGLIDDYSIPIKAADPSGKIVANIMQWNKVEEIIRDQGQHVDLIDHHWYYTNRTWPQFWVDDWRMDEDMNGRVGRFSQFKQWIETYNMPHIKLGLLEWNIGRAEGLEGSTVGTDLYQGLLQADMLMLFVEHDIYMSSVWPLMWNYTWRNLTDESGNYLSPVHHVLRAFSKAAGGTVLNMVVPAVQGLGSLAVKSEDEGFIDIYLLNKSTVAIDLEIDLPVQFVEAVVMNFVQGTSVGEVDVNYQQLVGNQELLSLRLGDSSFTHVRYRLSGRSTSYDLFSDDFDSAENPINEADAPYPVGRWHQQGSEEWSTESSETSVDLGVFNGSNGKEMRIGWGVDEVVTVCSTPFPIQTGQNYSFRGRWQVENVTGDSRGFIAGIAEFSADDGSLVQRLTPDSMVFGNTTAPEIGDRGLFEVILSSFDLAAAGTAPGNLIGVFIHHNNGDNLYDGTTGLKNNVYTIDNVFLEVSGSVTLLDQWMAINKIVNAQSDSDRDGLNDGLEYLFGGDPTVDDASTIVPSLAVVQDLGTNWLEFVYRQRSDHDVTGFDYIAESTTSLASNDWDTGHVTYVGTESIDANTESVTIRVNIDDAPQQFVRLRVEQAW